MNNTNGSEDYFLRMTDSQDKAQLGRMAVIIEPNVHSFLLQELRNRFSVVVANTLKELRAGFRLQEDELVACFDIRGLSEETTQTLAQCMSEISSPSQGVVYILSEKQFALFSDVPFGFVQR